MLNNSCRKIINVEQVDKLENLNDAAHKLKRTFNSAKETA